MATPPRSCPAGTSAASPPAVDVINKMWHATNRVHASPAKGEAHRRAVRIARPGHQALPGVRPPPCCRHTALSATICQREVSWDRLGAY